MNVEQKKWTLSKLEVLLSLARDFQNFTDEDWERILDYSNKTVNQAKGNKEVREAFLETLTYIEKMEKLMR